MYVYEHVRVFCFLSSTLTYQNQLIIGCVGMHNIHLSIPHSHACNQPIAECNRTALHGCVHAMYVDV